MKKVKKTPSRLKYEREHPTVSLRVSRDIYERLQAVKKAEDKSVADVLKTGLGLLEVKIRTEREIRIRAYDEGEEKGIERAVEAYAMKYPCSVCGEEMLVDTEKAKSAIREFIREQRWGHHNCVNRR